MISLLFVFVICILFNICGDKAFNSIKLRNLSKLEGNCISIAFARV